MDLRRAGQLSSRAGDPQQFTGRVWRDDLDEVVPPSRLRAALVTFEPGARTAWHSHPLGQVLLAVSGIGFAQAGVEDAVELHPGDTLVIPHGETHWHGADADRIFSHVAVQQADEKDAQAHWGEHVSGDDYARANDAGARR